MPKKLRLSQSFLEGEVEVLHLLIQAATRDDNDRSVTHHKDFASTAKKIQTMKKKSLEK